MPIEDRPQRLLYAISRRFPFHAFRSKFLDLTHGILSHDRFNQVLAAIRPAEFEQCLLSWI